MSSVNGKVALITGGANGIGAEVARRLHAKGAKLVLTAHFANSLRLPLKKTTSVEKCGEAFINGIEERKSRIYCPEWGWV